MKFALWSFLRRSWNIRRFHDHRRFWLFPEKDLVEKTSGIELTICVKVSSFDGLFESSDLFKLRECYVAKPQASWNYPLIDGGGFIT